MYLLFCFRYGWSALHYACTEGHKDVVEYLKASGIDIYLRDKDGTTGAFRAQVQISFKFWEFPVQKVCNPLLLLYLNWRLLFKHKKMGSMAGWHKVLFSVLDHHLKNKNNLMSTLRNPYILPKFLKICIELKKFGTSRRGMVCLTLCGIIFAKNWMKMKKIGMGRRGGGEARSATKVALNYSVLSFKVLLITQIVMTFFRSTGKPARRARELPVSVRRWRRPAQRLWRRRNTIIAC